jgi:hypothetical protein
MQAAGDEHSVVEAQHGVAGENVGLGVRVGADLARQRQFGYPLGETAGNGERLVPISVDDGVGKNVPILVGQLGIQQLALGPEHTAQDRVARRIGGGFQLVEGGGWLEGRGMRRGQIEGSKFGQLVTGGIV